MKLQHLLGLVVAVLATACTPATPAPEPTCPPPPCPAGSTLTCPYGDCADNCALICEYAPPQAVTPSLPDVGPTWPATPSPLCTPPACWNNESYVCPGTCPGGCGTTCATHTPNPQASATPVFPEPPCERTAPGGFATPSLQAALFTCAPSADLPTGATWQVWGTALNLTNPTYNIDVVNASGAVVAQARLAPPDRTRMMFAEPGLAFVALYARDNQLYVALQADTPGTYTLLLSVISADFSARASATPLTVTIR